MELPGGLIVDEQLRRDFSFKPLTGFLERVISESGFAVNSLAEQVSIILMQALERVAGLVVSEELVCSLCSGDRRYLILQLEALIDPSPQWLTSNCQACDELIQFQINPATMPVKPSGKGFPQTSIALSIGDVSLRVPTGVDEEELANRAQNEKNAMNILLNRLLYSSAQPVDASELNAEDLDLIDMTLDEMTPQAGGAASITCPYCTKQQQISIDNYAWITRKIQRLDKDIHTLAIHYHWSEKEILALPRYRRQRYLQLIERSLGKHQADDFIQGMQGVAE